MKYSVWAFFFKPGCLVRVNPGGVEVGREVSEPQLLSTPPPPLPVRWLPFPASAERQTSSSPSFRLSSFLPLSHTSSWSCADKLRSCYFSPLEPVRLLKFNSSIKEPLKENKSDKCPDVFLWSDVIKLMGLALLPEAQTSAPGEGNLEVYM